MALSNTVSLSGFFVMVSILFQLVTFIDCCLAFCDFTGSGNRGSLNNKVEKILTNKHCKQQAGLLSFRRKQRTKSSGIWKIAAEKGGGHSDDEPSKAAANGSAEVCIKDKEIKKDPRKPKKSNATRKRKSKSKPSKEDRNVPDSDPSLDDESLKVTQLFDLVKHLDTLLQDDRDLAQGQAAAFHENLNTSSSEQNERQRAQNFFVSATGPDRTGIVADLTKAVLDHDGSVGKSKMEKIGGDFCIVMKVDHIQDSKADSFKTIISRVPGMKVTVYPASIEPEPPVLAPKFRATFKLEGTDSPGLVYSVTTFLGQHGIWINELQTEVKSAPSGGKSLFMMKGKATSDIEVDVCRVRKGFKELENELNVNLFLSESEV
eukprot:CAMPEP_0117750938 /NCGR_PEP_ID=MMETSP0947-20121206/10672_1 /TAXON_ID=44440 /ORGANISM="Chattonella subsalsa, Strain CCMP2191" /LENGTH=374 /DNA_ID=CAMNT_0005569213 /DNA_START=90 /DNA_END=1214 /DNA_ORIENTATION=+